METSVERLRPRLVFAHAPGAASHQRSRTHLRPHLSLLPQPARSRASSACSRHGRVGWDRVGWDPGGTRPGTRPLGTLLRRKANERPTHRCLERDASPPAAHAHATRVRHGFERRHVHVHAFFFFFNKYSRPSAHSIPGFASAD